MNSSWLKSSPIRYGGRKMVTTDWPKKTESSPSTSMGARSGFVHAAGCPGARSAGCSAMGGFLLEDARARDIPATGARALRHRVLDGNPGDAGPDGAEDLVRDGVAEAREIVRRDALAALIAHQHHFLALADGGHVGHVDHRHVHADGADLLDALASDQHLALVG